MKNLEQVNWGIIGVGDVCEVKSGPAFQKVPNSNLVAVMRRNTQAAEDFARRHHVPKWYDQAEALINDPEINAVYVATPPDSHAAYTSMIARAGKPVYVEKPMARTVAECQGMIADCENANVPLYIAYYRRCLPNILYVKEIIESGAIGDIRFVEVKLIKPVEPDIVGAAGQQGNWRINPEIAGGGYFFDLACHQLDALDFLLGPIAEASGQSANQSKRYLADDMTTASFGFKSGALGVGTWCFNSANANQTEVTTIYGSKGAVSFPFFGDHSVTLTLDGKPVERKTFDIPKNIQLPLIQTIVDDLRGVAKCPSTGHSALRTNQVMEMITSQAKSVLTSSAC